VWRVGGVVCVCEVTSVTCWWCRVCVWGDECDVLVLSCVCVRWRVWRVGVVVCVCCMTCVFSRGQAISCVWCGVCMCMCVCVSHDVCAIVARRVCVWRVSCAMSVCFVCVCGMTWLVGVWCVRVSCSSCDMRAWSDSCDSTPMCARYRSPTCHIRTQVLHQSVICLIRGCQVYLYRMCNACLIYDVM